MFNNEIKSLAENCFDTLKQMGEIHFCSSCMGFLFGRRRRRRFDKSSLDYCIFEVGGSSWTDKTIPDESINFICDAYIHTSMAIKSQAIVRIVQNVAERIAHPTINHTFHLLACKCSFIVCTCMCVRLRLPPPSLTAYEYIHLFFCKNLCARFFPGHALLSLLFYVESISFIYCCFMLCLSFRFSYHQRQR